MNLSEIKTLYPDAIIMQQNTTNEDYAAFPYQGKWIQFDRAQKSASELTLIEYLLKESAAQMKSGLASPWRAFLFEDSFALPSADGPCRIIQFSITQKDASFERDLWLKEFTSLFFNVKDAFFHTDTTGVLVQEKTTASISNEEIAGIIQTLDEDFSIKTAYFTGLFWPVDVSMQHIFKEEARIFDTQKNSPNKVLNLSKAALNYYTAEAVTKSPIMHQLKSLFSDQPEWKELTIAMWKSQGNVSVAAKSLFVHRNTLQYRMDKLQEATGLSLRNMDDLVLCYLLTV